MVCTYVRIYTYVCVVLYFIATQIRCNTIQISTLQQVSLLLTGGLVVDGLVVGGFVTITLSSK